MSRRFGVRLTMLLLGLMVTQATWAREQWLRNDPPSRRGNENSERLGRVPIWSGGHAGNGCPEGTSRTVFAPDSLSFTVLFDAFVAETLDAQDVVKCTTLINMQIPPGKQMAITRVDLRGFAGLPAGAVSNLSSTFNFQGYGMRDRLQLRHRFQGPMSEDFTLSSDALSEPELSPCGGNVQLRISYQLKVQSVHADQWAQITLDSADSSAVYFMTWKSCRGREQRRNDP